MAKATADQTGQLLDIDCELLIQHCQKLEEHSQRQAGLMMMSDE